MPAAVSGDRVADHQSPEPHSITNKTGWVVSPATVMGPLFGVFCHPSRWQATGRRVRVSDSFTAVQALGIDPEQDSRTMPGALGQRPEVRPRRSARARQQRAADHRAGPPAEKRPALGPGRRHTPRPVSVSLGLPRTRSTAQVVRSMVERYGSAPLTRGRASARLAAGLLDRALAGLPEQLARV
jgi:hypothetical protein